MFRKPRTCRTCGATFEGSRTDYTVNCPACRGKAHKPATSSRTVTTCRCGKTVVATNGVSTGLTCPRNCG